MAYLRDQLGDRDRHALEKRLLDDDFAREALEGLELAGPEAAAEDYAELQRRLGIAERVAAHRNTWWRWAAVAALTVALGVGLRYAVGLFEYQQKDLEQISLQRESGPAERALPEVPPVPEATGELPEERGEKGLLSTGTETEPAANVPAGERADEVFTEELAMADMEVAEDQPLMDDPGAAAAGSRAEPKAVTEAEKTYPAAPAAGPVQERTAVAAREADEESLERTQSRAVRRSLVAGPQLSGTVMSAEDGEALPGVNVVISGTASGVVTGPDGSFSLSLDGGDAGELLVNSVGYRNRQVPFRPGDTLSIVLEPDYSTLSEVVVTGYGQNREMPAEGGDLAPEPRGGWPAFNRYLREHMRYPANIPVPAPRASVRLKAQVSAEGELQNLEVLRSTGPEFEREALRLLREGPDWKPASQNGRPVPSDVIIRIRFKPLE
jgi:TonB family protein